MPEPLIRHSPRLVGFDYSSAGAYFVTICLADMSRLRFGHIEQDQLMLTSAGGLVASCWQSNFDRFPGAALDVWVVMPNHLHAIVFIGADPEIKPPSLTSIVGAFKSESAVEYGKNVRTGAFPPYDRVLWQRSFYDRILGSERALETARLYIEGNPARWIERYR